MQYFLAVFSAVALAIVLAYGAYLLTSQVDPAIVGGVLTASSAVVISALTLAFGRYFEKKRELEALHREKKIPIYAEFLEGLFNTFYGAKSNKRVDGVALLQKWQMRIALWGGPEVVNAYVHWAKVLRKGIPNVDTVNATNALVLAIRRELGHNDRRIVKNLFARFILREYDLYERLSKENPALTLEEMARHEEQAAKTIAGS